MKGVPGVRVIVSDGNLDAEEFQVQARFFVKPATDPRFRFRLHFHQPAAFAAFDIVIFDSPPRVTASVVNALACSDSVLIPTKLDRGSIDAVPRTLAWMRSLGASCPAELLGVVASHVTLRAGKPVSADNESYEYLRGVVKSEYGDAGKLFKAVVPQSAKAVGADREIGSLTTDGQKVFASVVREVRGRMGL
jgi:cellulose biosynthesis protein BcsQ